MAAARQNLDKWLVPPLVLILIATLLFSACTKPASPSPASTPAPTPSSPSPSPPPTPAPTSPTTMPTTPVSTEPNQSPVILKIERSEEGKLRTWHTTTITCVAEDPDGDKLTYIWSTTASPHSIQGEGRSIGWVAPGIRGDYTVQVKVIDGRGGEAENSITIAVCCCDNC